VLLSSATPALVVVARSSNVASLDASKVLRQLLDQFGGKGGGKPDLAQGGGLNGAPEAIAASARELVGRTL
jgi:alanyl-tRNA synthetase